MSVIGAASAYYVHELLLRLGGGDNIRIITLQPDGTVENVPDYGTVQGILMGAVAAFVLIVTFLGPENHGSHFEKHKAAFEMGGGEDDAYMDDGRDVEALGVEVDPDKGVLDITSYEEEESEEESKKD